jgi:DASH complex subunit DAD1
MEVALRLLPLSQVGNEFSSVEALWSQFEGVMAKEEPLPQAQQNQGPESQRRDEGVKREEAGGRGGSVRESREGNGEGEDEDVKMEGD